MSNYQQQAANYASQQKAWNNQNYGWNGEMGPTPHSSAPMNPLTMGPPPPPPESTAIENPNLPSQQWTASGYAHWNAYGGWQPPGSGAWPTQYACPQQPPAPYTCTQQPPAANQWGYYYGAGPPPPPPATGETAGIGSSEMEQKNDFDESNDPDLVEFDKQFKTWEEKYDTWKEENKNHPDKESLASYESTWKKWREDLLKKREELKKTKIESNTQVTTSNTNTTENIATDVAPPYQGNSEYSYPPYTSQPPAGFGMPRGVRPVVPPQHVNTQYDAHRGPPPNMRGPRPYMTRGPPPSNITANSALDNYGNVSKPFPDDEHRNPSWPINEETSPMFPSTPAVSVGIPGLDIPQSEEKHNSEKEMSPTKEIKTEIKIEDEEKPKLTTFNRNIGPIGLGQHAPVDPDIAKEWKPPQEWYEDDEENENQMGEHKGHGNKRDASELANFEAPPSKYICNKPYPSDPNAFGHKTYDQMPGSDSSRMRPYEKMGNYGERFPHGERGSHGLLTDESRLGGSNVDNHPTRSQLDNDWYDRPGLERAKFGRESSESSNFGRGQPGERFGRGGPVESDMLGRGRPPGDRFVRGGPPGNRFGRGGPPESDRYGRGGPQEGDRFGTGMIPDNAFSTGDQPPNMLGRGGQSEVDRFGRGGPPGDRFGRGGPPGDRFGRGGPPGDHFGRGGISESGRMGRGVSLPGDRMCREGSSEGGRVGRDVLAEGDRMGRGTPSEGDRFGRGGTAPGGDRFGRGGTAPGGDRFGRGGPPGVDRFDRGRPPPGGDRFGRGGPPEGDRFGRGGRPGDRFGRGGPPEGDGFGTGGPPEGERFGRGGRPADRFDRGGPPEGDRLGRGGPPEGDRFGKGGRPEGDRFDRGGRPVDRYGRGGPSEAHDKGGSSEGIGRGGAPSEVDRFGRGGPPRDRFVQSGPPGHNFGREELLEGDRFGKREESAETRFGGVGPQGDRLHDIPPPEEDILSGGRPGDDIFDEQQGDQIGRDSLLGNRFGRGGPLLGDRFGRGGPLLGDRFGRGGPPSGDRFGRGGPPSGDRFGRGGPPSGDQFGRGGPPSGDRGGQRSGDRFAREQSSEGDRFGRGQPGDRFGRGGPPEEERFVRGGPPGNRFGRGGAPDGDRYGRGGPPDADRYGRGGPPERTRFGRTGPSDVDRFGREEPLEGDRFQKGRPRDNFDKVGLLDKFGVEGTSDRVQKTGAEGERSGRTEQRDGLNSTIGQNERRDGINENKFGRFTPHEERPKFESSRFGPSTSCRESFGKSRTNDKSYGSTPYGIGMPRSEFERSGRESEGERKPSLLQTPPKDEGYRGSERPAPKSHLLDRFGRSSPNGNRLDNGSNQSDSRYNRFGRMNPELSKGSFDKRNDFREQVDQFESKTTPLEGRPQELMKLTFNKSTEREGREQEINKDRSQNEFPSRLSSNRIEERKPWENDRFERNTEQYRPRSSNEYSKSEDSNHRSISKDRFRNVQEDQNSQIHEIEKNKSSEKKLKKNEESSREKLQPQTENTPPTTKVSDQIKGERVSIDDIISVPGRFMRPPKLVIILRGLPGSGKTTMAKMIKNREIENGGSAPRILCLDDYFMVETEKMTKDVETGRTVKTKAMEYEYEPELEDRYRSALIKSFKKQVDEKYFPFIIVDCIHSHSRNYMEICEYAQKNDFEPYIAELDVDIQTCVHRNSHGRERIDIQRLSLQWELSPSHITQLDLTSYMQDADIQEVEMEDCMIEESVEVTEVTDEKEKSEDDESDETFTIIKQLMKSKWDAVESQEATLDKLDGVRSAKKKMSESKPQSIDDWLQLSKEFDDRDKLPGKKRVRWADIEERKKQESARERGFVLGQTDWQRMTDPSMGSSALVQVKYI